MCLLHCTNAIKGRKEVLIPGTKAPFSQEEVHWVEATFFDDICNNSTKFKPRGVSLTEVETNNDVEVDIIEQEKTMIERIILPDGRKIYKL